MLRVEYRKPTSHFFAQDPKKSIPFYESLGMTCIRENHFSDFSLYFLATLPEGTTAPASDSDEARAFCKNLFPPVLELTHNHGTETQEDFAHNTGICHAF